MKVSSYNTATNNTVLVHGLPGTGKSTLVSQLANKFKLIWFDLDNSAKILTKLPEKAQANVELLHIRDSANAPVATQSLMILFKTGKLNACDNHGIHECAMCKKDGRSFTKVDLTVLQEDTIVVVDTITQLSHSILSYVTRDKSIETFTSRDDWGNLRKYTEFFSSQWKAANYNLVCIAHTTEAVLETGKTKLVPNFGSAGMSAEIGGSFGTVVYTDIVNGIPKAFSSIKYSNGVLTRSRDDIEIEKLPTPSLERIFMKQ